MIYIENKRRSLKLLQAKYPAAVIIDITSKAAEPYVKLSPFYPHGGIPVPFSENETAESVEGIWQGLKVFATEDVDVSKFLISNMKGLKRTVRKLGLPKGHRNGIYGLECFDYITARKKIYLPAYEWVLKHKAGDVLDELKQIAETRDLVLLDYETNENIEDGRKPLSHASLVKNYLLKKSI